jgi:penicillin G amidase
MSPIRPTGPPPARRVKRSKGSGRRWFRLLLLAVMLVLLVAGGVGGFVFYQLRGSLPQVEGTAKLQGLTTAVDVLRDENGVPHLFGADIRDLSRAMGYTHAQDRFFQMELSRRFGAGRLAEIFGAPALATDRVARRMGLASAARMELERMAPEAREVLEAYASGVNGYLAAHADRLPPEFRLLGLTPTPWEAADSLTIGKSMSHFLSYNGRVEMLRGNLAASIGLEDAYRLTGLPAPAETLPTSALPGAAVRVAALDETSPTRLGIFPGASNAWVVGSEKSATGRPLLASDPHLGLAIPSTWFEIHLSGGGYDVAGASLPGVPMVLIGRNRRIAWGITALLADVQDLYLETKNPENPRQYAAPEGFRDLEVVTETITVKDGAPVTEEVRVSRHGVIVGETRDGRLLAQRWDALWSGDHFQALLALNRAGSWEEFTSSLRTWASPPLAFLYADVEGNIGFFPAGEIPVRTAHDGTLPVDGATDAYEWQGSIPHELKPMIFNPEDGILVSANHAMLPPEAPYPLGADTLAPNRANRIRDLLRTIPKSTLDDFARIQGDRYDSSTERVLRVAVGLKPTEGMAVAAIEKLRGWNGQMTEGPAPAIYQALYQRLIENTFKDEIGEELFPSYLDFLELGHSGGLYAVLDDAASPYWDDRGTPEVETRERIFLASTGEAIELLSSRQGNDVNAWDWRTLHAIPFEHPMGMEEPLAWLFSRGPVPFGGSTHTVANAVVSLREPFETPLGTSFRFLADLSNPDLSRSIIPTGASGHPLSPHYFDQNAGWLAGRSHALPVERATIEASTRGKLTLQP